MKSIDLSKAVIIATAINLPAYAIVNFFDIDIYVPLLTALVFLSFITVFLAVLSYWFLIFFSSRTPLSGLWFGSVMAVTTLVLDYIFFGIFLGQGFEFLRSYLTIVYPEMVLVSAVLGIYISGKDSAKQSG